MLGSDLHIIRMVVTLWEREGAELGEAYRLIGYGMLIIL